MYQLTYGQKLSDYRRRLAYFAAVRARRRRARRRYYSSRFRRYQPRGRIGFSSVDLPLMNVLKDVVAEAVSNKENELMVKMDIADDGRKRAGGPIVNDDVRPVKSLAVDDSVDGQPREKVGRISYDHVVRKPTVTRKRYDNRSAYNRAIDRGQVPIKRYLFANLGPESDKYGNQYDRVVVYQNGLNGRLVSLRTDQFSQYSGYQGSIAADIGNIFSRLGETDRGYSRVFTLDVDQRGHGVISLVPNMYGSDLYNGNKDLARYVPSENAEWSFPVGGDIPHVRLDKVFADGYRYRSRPGMERDSVGEAADRIWRFFHAENFAQFDGFHDKSFAGQPNEEINDDVRDELKR